jgi:hypothetical protein
MMRQLTYVDDAEGPENARDRYHLFASFLQAEEAAARRREEQDEDEDDEGEAESPTF